jgi:hypothetical protein
MITTAGTIGPMDRLAPACRVRTVGYAARLALAVPRAGLPTTIMARPVPKPIGMEDPL